jgi:predicted RecA/RadA family phage recombinase
MRNYVQPGNVVTLTAPAGGVLSSQGVLIGSLFGVAAYDAKAGAEVEVEVVGVYDLPKDSEALAEGARAYWNSTNKNVTATASGNKLIGAAVKAAGSSDTTVNVRLNGVAI